MSGIHQQPGNPFYMHSPPSLSSTYLGAEERMQRRFDGHRNSAEHTRSKRNPCDPIHGLEMSTGTEQQPYSGASDLSDQQCLFRPSGRPLAPAEPTSEGTQAVGAAIGSDLTMSLGRWNPVLLQAA